MFDNRQMYALKHLYGWRDRIAREEDESTGYANQSRWKFNFPDIDNLSS